MLGFSTRKTVKNRASRKIINPLTAHVRKVLSTSDQRLIVMVKD